MALPEAVVQENPPGGVIPKPRRTTPRGEQAQAPDLGPAPSPVRQMSSSGLQRQPGPWNTLSIALLCSQPDHQRSKSAGGQFPPWVSLGESLNCPRASPSGTSSGSKPHQSLLGFKSSGDPSPGITLPLPPGPEAGPVGCRPDFGGEHRGADRSPSEACSPGGLHTGPGMLFRWGAGWRPGHRQAGKTRPGSTPRPTRRCSPRSPLEKTCSQSQRESGPPGPAPGRRGPPIYRMLPVFLPGLPAGVPLPGEPGVPCRGAVRRRMVHVPKTGHMGCSPPGVLPLRQGCPSPPGWPERRGRSAPAPAAPGRCAG